MTQKEKMIVAVHGIGDQTSYETIQAVGRQIFRSRQFPGAVPLGWYYGNLKKDPHDKAAEGFLRYRKLCPRRDPQQNQPPCNSCGFDSQHGCFSFAEVYWAGIPRVPESSGHILEDTKKWAKTVVERLHAQQVRRADGGKAGLDLSPENYKNIKQVLVEMIESVAILERLLGWLESHTRLRFPFKRILVDYLGDVQVVADFRQYRESILKEFRSVMQALHAGNPDAEIYLIAHSEGSVVALLGLLRGLASAKRPKEDLWIENVRGLMTIGSPIDKHLILWPELWKEFEGGVAWRKVRPIPWYNYYDYGDPVGFDLDTARTWIEQIAKNPPLQLKAENDIGFSRYVFPGKAHNDYWRDDKVFRHFIDNVILNKPSDDKPASISVVQLASAVIPYLIVTALCGAGTYILYKATVAAIHGQVSPGETARDVSLLAIILVFATASARIPRLARKTWAWVTAVVLAAGAAGLVCLLSEDFFSPIVKELPKSAHHLAWIFPAGIAMAISGVGWFSGVKRPHWGMLPMLAAGVTGIGVLVYTMASDASVKELWPVAVAGVGFLYLWWLAALVFDLSFIWHRYICQNTGMVRLASIGTGDDRPTRPLWTRKLVTEPANTTEI